MSKYFDGELLSGYEESPKTTTSNTSNFVGLLNKEMDSLVDDYSKRRIADLEAKLAESEEKYNACQEARKLEIEFNQQDKAQLKQQLAEKEEEYQSFKKIADENVNYLKNRILEETRNYNQDKISFAVEQLEKVKDYLTQELENVTELLDPLEYEDYHEFIGCGRGYKNSIEEIDNQIKQLTHQHEDKGEKK